MLTVKQVIDRLQAILAENGGADMWLDAHGMDDPPEYGTAEVIGMYVNHTPVAYRKTVVLTLN